MTKLNVARLAAIIAILCFAAVPPLWADWPSYQHDMARSGVTTETLELPLAEKWTFIGNGPAIPAWQDPQDVAIEGNIEEPRVRFDAAYHAAMADGLVYFGTSCDNKIYCIDGETGAEVWSVMTGGPVRLAPTLSGGRVYVGSDDGIIYCLDGKDGSEVWRFYAAPTPEKVLARGKMTNLHPPRTGVLVDDGVAYFGAGIFPGERVYLYAVNAEDGSLVWKNDTISDGGAGQNGFSPQGYMLATNDTLYVPSGRATPAAFNRATGKFIHQRSYSWRSVGQVGGTYALLAGDHLFTGTGQVIGYDAKSGNIGFAWFKGRRLVVTQDTSYMLGAGGLKALNRVEYPTLSNQQRDVAARRKAIEAAKAEDMDDQLEKLKEEEDTLNEALEACSLWNLDQEEFATMIVAGELVIAGGNGNVVVVDGKSGESLWGAAIEGNAEGLAVSDGRLVVSTDAGTVHCFGTGAATANEVGAADGAEIDDELTAVYADAAQDIVDQTGVEEGFCLVLGSGQGRLAHELSKITDLQIYCADPDADDVASARDYLLNAGIYGTRVTVDQTDLDSLPYASYFANLIVSDDALVAGDLSAASSEALRCLKPVGGAVCIGQPAGAKGAVKALKQKPLRDWMDELGEENVKVTTDDGIWAMAVRGSLEGAGSWTHQYGDAGNTASTTDTFVRAPLGVLWYGEPGPADAVNRHVGTAAPLSIDGRVFYQGEYEIICFDAYNGVQYWRREIPGARRTGMVRETSNLACDGDSLYLAAGSQCLRLDAFTGETTMTYELPPSQGGGNPTWAYVALVDDTLYGSVAVRGQESTSVFAVDTGSGDLKWVYLGSKIRNNTISIDGGRVFFADNSASSEDRQKALAAEIKELMDAEGIEASAAEEKLTGVDVRLAIALDAGTGEVIWQHPLDLTDAGGAVLSCIAARGTVVFCGSHWNGHFWPQFLGGEYGSRRATVLDAEDGSLLWTKAIGYRIRPLVLEDMLIAEPWGFDLRTGKQKMRKHPITGREQPWQFERPGHHCGTISASPNALYYRSGSIAYYDLLTDYGTNHFAGQRPGCWINLVPANGLLLAPEASSGCVCTFSIHCTTVFAPRPMNKAWGVFSSPGESKPVKQLAVNFGAPGDRRGPEGRLWFGFPHTSGRMQTKFDVNVSYVAGGAYFSDPSEYFDVEGTEAPWLYASGAKGVIACSIPLVDEGDGAALYDVRLAFAAPADEAPGTRVFDVKIQGETVLEGFDVVAEAGGTGKAIERDFTGIRVDKDLDIEFDPVAETPTADDAPIVNAIAVNRTEVLTVGLAVPEFMISDLDNEVTSDVVVTNMRESAFSGELRVTAPEGFSVDPGTIAVNIDADSETTVPVTLKVETAGEPTDFSLSVELLKGDGAQENTGESSVRYLGPRGRVTLNPIQDTYGSHGQPGNNYGHNATLLVDGGNSKFGDESHNIAYLKFAYDIPGKSVFVKFRIRTTPTGHSQSGDSGTIHIVPNEWDEYALKYTGRPEPGTQIGKLGAVGNDVWEERDLEIELSGQGELSIVLEPTGNDGATYHARETAAFAPELVIEYEPE